jgi:hypothetical protein
MSEALVNTFDTILTTFRALLAVGSPKPFKDGREAAKAVFAPEVGTEQPDELSDFANSVRSKPWWKSAIEQYWVRSSREDIMAEDFEKLEASLAAGVTLEKCSDFMAKTRSWPFLQSAALSDMKGSVLKFISKEMSELLSQDVPSESEALTKFKAAVEEHLTVLTYVAGDNILYKTLKEDGEKVLGKIAQSNASELLGSLAASFTGARSEVGPLRQALQQASTGKLPRNQIDAVMSARIKVLESFNTMAASASLTDDSCGYLTDLLRDMHTAAEGQDRAIFNKEDADFTMALLAKATTAVEAWAAAVSSTGAALDGTVLSTGKTAKADWDAFVRAPVDESEPAIDKVFRTKFVATVNTALSQGMDDFQKRISELLGARSQDFSFSCVHGQPVVTSIPWFVCNFISHLGMFFRGGAP